MTKIVIDNDFRHQLVLIKERSLVMMNTKIWYKWLLNYSAGEVLGMGAVIVTGRLLLVEFSDFMSHSATFITPSVLLLIGIAEGGMLGYIQWRLLMKLDVGFKAHSWIRATVGATVFGWLVLIPPAILLISIFVDFSPASEYYSVLYTMLLGLTYGTIIGVPQYFILRRFYSDAESWIIANAISWMFSFLIVYFSLSILHIMNGVFFDVLFLSLACVLSGLIHGLITGTVLHHLTTKDDAIQRKG